MRRADLRSMKSRASEVARFAADRAGEALDIEQLERGDPALAGDHRLPERLDAGAVGGDRAHAGHDDTHSVGGDHG